MCRRCSELTQFAIAPADFFAGPSPKPRAQQGNSVYTPPLRSLAAGGSLLLRFALAREIRQQSTLELRPTERPTSVRPAALRLLRNQENARWRRTPKRNGFFPPFFPSRVSLLGAIDLVFASY